MGPLEKIKKIKPAAYCSDLYGRLEQAGITSWPVRATALSYYCLMGLVPFLALCFVVAKGFGLDSVLADFIDNGVTDYFASFAGQDAGPADHENVILWQKKIITSLTSFSDNFINRYSGSLMVFVALGVIFWSGYRILTLMESVFGEIFGYNPSRRLVHRAMDYFTVMAIVPLVLMAALAINFYLTGLATETWDLPGGIDLSIFKSIFIILLPYIIMWLVFSWVYAYFSRGLIKWRERLLGGFITCLIFQATLAFYLKIMFAISSYSAFYGGFAFIPLFMIWLYLAWLIVLAGGELSRRFFDLFTTGRGFWRLAVPVTWRSTVELAGRVLDEIIKNYQHEPGGGPTSFRQLAKATGAPLPTLGGVINRLLDVRLVVRISGPGRGDGPAFLPAVSPDKLTGDFIAETLENGTLEIYS